MGKPGITRAHTGTGNRDHPIAFRFSDREVAALEKQRTDRGFTSNSAYIRFLILNDQQAAAFDAVSRERKAKRVGGD